MHQIAVVIPSYNVAATICDVVEKALPFASRIYVVDDHCPQSSGQVVEKRQFGERVRVLRNPSNVGVGGATLAGFAAAFKDGADIVVKMDGDDQMDARDIPGLVAPIVGVWADFTKGNRFYNPEDLTEMPFIRLFGNAVLSFMSKVSSGYWRVFDPTNGFIAIHKTAYETLRKDRISQRFFFESDLLFRLNIIRAVVRDVPIRARYGDEKSNLRIWKVWPLFLFGHCRNFFKRLFYSYLLRDFNIASIELFLGSLSLLFGVVFGSWQWHRALTGSVAATPGTVMLAALPVVLGFQMILAFLNYDSTATPRTPLQLKIPQALAKNGEAREPVRS